MSILTTPDPENWSAGPKTGGPFFTVLLPTMNRPQLLEAAIKTVLWQTCKDFELIVSDNSSDATSITRNRRTMAKYAHDPRVHFIRPPQWMNMPDHWEFASRHASGRYVLILTDRHVMRPSALHFLQVQISYFQEDAKVIAWHGSSAFNRAGIVITEPFTGAREVLDSKQELCEYAKCARWRSSPVWANRLPRMLNSCYRFEVAHTIREQHGRLFMPISPDYTCAYLLLAYTDRIAYLDLPLFMSHGDQGNGQRSLVQGVKGYVSSLGDGDLFAGPPVPLTTVTNSLIRDLLMVKNLVGARLADVSLDVVGYFMSNYRELLISEQLGSQMDVAALYAQWWQGIETLSPEQQNLIKGYANELEKERAPFTDLRRLSVRFGLDQSYHALVAAVRQIRHRLAGKPVYANVLEAARQTDHLLTDAGESAQKKG